MKTLRLSHRFPFLILAVLGIAMAKAKPSKPVSPAPVPKSAPVTQVDLHLHHESKLPLFEKEVLPLDRAGETIQSRWILTPKPGANLSDFLDEVGALEKSAVIRSVEPLFQESDRKWIAEKDPTHRLENSIIADLPSQRVPKSGSILFERASSTVDLEADVEVEKVFALPSLAPSVVKDPAALQWGMNNDGSGVRIELDGYRSVPVSGKVQEDSAALRTSKPESSSGPGILIAVLDTGIDWDHPALAGKIRETPSECAALKLLQDCLKAPKADAAACQSKFGNVDTDQNGYPLDCRGFNITAGLNRTFGVYGNYDTRDDLGHGTHVSGIIAAATHSLGFRGVIQNAKILPVRVVSRAPNAPQRPQSTSAPALPSPSEKTLRIGQSFTEQIGRGMLYALRNGAQVINLSMAWPKSADSGFMRQMTALAGSLGVAVIASAGNDSTDARVMPCQYDSVICVASHGPDGRLSHFSNHGSFVDLAAPGTAILSTWPLSIRSKKFVAVPGYEFKNGTSMASPFVAGAVARLLNEGIPTSEIRPRLLLGSRPAVLAETGTSGTRKQIRFGNLDLEGAFSVTPQPWIESLNKTAITVSWDRKAGSYAFSFELVNRWVDAASVAIEASLESPEKPGAAVDGLSLGQDRWTETQWQGFESRKFFSSLVVSDPLVQGRAVIRLKIVPDQGRSHTIFIPVDFSMEVRQHPVGPKTIPQPGVTVKPIFAKEDPSLGQVALNPGAVLRSIKSVDAKVQPRGTWLIQEGGINQDLGLLREEADTIEWSQWSYHFPKGAEVLQYLELDVTGDGKTEFAFLVKIPPSTPSELTRIQFEIVDESGNWIASLAVSELGVVLDPKYTWTEIPKNLRDAKSPLTRAPIWIFDGALPELNQKLGIASSKPPKKEAWEDEWNPKVDAPLIDRRVYLAGTLGILALPTEDLGIPVEVLERGNFSDAPSILFAHAQEGSSDLNYRIAKVAAATPGFSGATDLVLPFHRTLLGVADQSAVLPWDLSRPDFGKVFSTPAPNGSARLTLIEGSQGFQDHLLPAPYLLSMIKRVVAVFQGGSHSWALGHTDHDLVFRNLSTGVTSVTSLDRFSFMPQLAAMRLLTPVLAEGRPSIFVPSSIATSDTSEVIQATSAGISRPARLRFKSGQGCQPMGDPIPASASSPAQIAFVCEDQIVLIDL
ncbi:MAG: S8 family serine peptidase [Bdellovibrionales bacterium]|nr:S8 family serine peptidase [Bdellovibrionales bacterium]